MTKSITIFKKVLEKVRGGEYDAYFRESCPNVYDADDALDAKEKVVDFLECRIIESQDDEE